jgi:hypothetical protein
MKEDSERERETEDDGSSNRPSLKTRRHFNNYDFWKHKVRSSILNFQKILLLPLLFLQSLM